MAPRATADFNGFLATSKACSEVILGVHPRIRYRRDARAGRCCCYEVLCGGDILLLPPCPLPFWSCCCVIVIVVFKFVSGERKGSFGAARNDMYSGARQTARFQLDFTHSCALPRTRLHQVRQPDSNLLCSSITHPCPQLKRRNRIQLQ